MTEQAPGYDAGIPQPQHEWVRCTVRVPAATRAEAETASLAKVRCDDVIDALDLDRWAAVAFQHLWRSGHSSHAPTELGRALWYLKRATDDHQPEGRCIARLLRRLIERAEADGKDLRATLEQFARDAELAEYAAVSLIHHCSQEH